MTLWASLTRTSLGSGFPSTDNPKFSTVFIGFIIQHSSEFSPSQTSRQGAKAHCVTQLHPDCGIAPSLPHPSLSLRLCVTKSLIARDSLRFFTMPLTFKSSRAMSWFSLITRVDNLCKKSVRLSWILAWSLATFLRATERCLLPFCFLESWRCSFLNRLRFFFNGLGALIFSLSSNVAKLVIPKSIPRALP